MVLSRVLLAGFIFAGIPGSLFAMGKTFAMGGIYSVVPDGAFDAAKNPALMPLHAEGSVVGVLAQYLVGSAVRSSSYIEFQDPRSATTVDSNSIGVTILGSSLCYLARFGDSALGLSVTEGADPQYMSMTMKYRLQFFGTNSQEVEKVDTGYNPAFNITFGTRVSPHSTIGFLAAVKYSAKHTVEEKSSKSGDVEYAFITKTTDTSLTSAAIGFGYLYQRDDAQAGIVLTTGDLTWIGQTAHYDYADKRTLLNPATPDKSNTESALVTSNGVYTKPPGVVAGGYRRFSPQLAVAIEGSYVFQNSYRSNTLSISDPNNQGECAITELTTITRQGDVIFFKGGIEFNPVPGFAVMAGGSYGFEISATDKPTATERTNTSFETSSKESISATGGIVYESPQKFSVGIVGVYTDLVIRGRNREYSQSGSLNVKSTSRISLRLTSIGIGFQYAL